MSLSPLCSPGINPSLNAFSKPELRIHDKVLNIRYSFKYGLKILYKVLGVRIPGQWVSTWVTKNIVLPGKLTGHTCAKSAQIMWPSYVDTQRIPEKYNSLILACSRRNKTKWGHINEVCCFKLPLPVGTLILTRLRNSLLSTQWIPTIPGWPWLTSLAVGC